MTDVHFMSENQAWGTPAQFLDFLKVRRGWEPDLDAAASKDNAKAPEYYDLESDGLASAWFGDVWLNPPFGRELPKWLEKCAEEIEKPAVHSIYTLIPARTDTRWFHEIVMEKASMVYLIKGRFNFQFPGQVPGANAPFPSMLVVWRKRFVGLRNKAQVTVMEVPKYFRGFGHENNG